ncbi:MAG: sulfatase-like hydrolase/transferase [Sedimentisphaeraceae bacterium JB056]
MKRRDFLKLTALTSGAFLTGCGQSVFDTESPAFANGKKPNFLLLLTDDQRFSAVSALSNPNVKTPNMDRLVNSGVNFTHAFNQGSWSGAVCICSRGMLNCGQYLYHTQENIETAPLWGETLQKYGYDTFLTGKWHNGEAALKRSFSTIGDVGEGMYPSTDMDGDAYYRSSPSDSWKPYDKTRKGHWLERGGKIIHSSELWADNAIDYLQMRQNEKAEDPFFMYVGFNAPHDPRQSPKEFVDMYPLDEIEIPENFMPEHPFDQGQRYTLRDEILAPFPRTEEAVKMHLQEYYAIISHADQQIGRILDALEESGEAENTYIIFSSDHGLAVGCHGLMGKQNQYDHSIRMPLVMCGPDIKPGKKIDDMVYLHSMFATTCDLAGVPTPSCVEFKSLLPLMNGCGCGEEAIFGSYKDMQRMIRTERYKLIMYPIAKETQLFDLNKDPDELNNLAYKDSYRDKVYELFADFLYLQNQVGDELVIKSPYFS